MAEEGARKPASKWTAAIHSGRIRAEYPPDERPDTLEITRRLREELAAKGLKGFKKGGKVKKTGLAKVHKGERVLTAKQAQKPAVKRAVAAKGRPSGRKR